MDPGTMASEGGLPPFAPKQPSRCEWWLPLVMRFCLPAVMVSYWIFYRDSRLCNTASLFGVSAGFFVGEQLDGKALKEHVAITSVAVVSDLIEALSLVVAILMVSLGLFIALVEIGLTGINALFEMSTLTMVCLTIVVRMFRLRAWRAVGRALEGHRT